MSNTDTGVKSTVTIKNDNIFYLIKTRRRRQVITPLNLQY